MFFFIYFFVFDGNNYSPNVDIYPLFSYENKRFINNNNNSNN